MAKRKKNVTVYEIWEKNNWICDLCKRPCKQNDKVEILWCPLFDAIDENVQNPFSGKGKKKAGK